MRLDCIAALQHATYNAVQQPSGAAATPIEYHTGGIASLRQRCSPLYGALLCCRILY